MTRRIPYGVSNYNKLVGGEYYYVDKTWVLRELEPIVCPVFLRPRRFGKSLLTFMLESYYDVLYAPRFQELFGDTDIGRNPTPNHGCYNVIHLDFSPVDPGEDIGQLQKHFADVLYGELVTCLMRRGYALDALGERGDAVAMLKSAIRMLYAKNGCPAYVVIDEYDNFTNQLIQAGRDETYYETTGKDSFLKAFFKAIKAGIGDGTIANCFLTGVLPVTIDDLTSGFNIAKNVTLRPQLYEALGFTEEEVRSYTAEIFRDMDTPPDTQETVLADLKQYYDGYLMMPDAPRHLYNSTICNFYLDEFVSQNGRIPRDVVDPNVQMDLGWIERLAGSGEEASAFIRKLVWEGRVPFDWVTLSQHFNLQRFLTSEHLPASLFFLGQLTWLNGEELGFPNLTTRLLFVKKFNELNHFTCEGDQVLSAAFRQYRKDGDFAALFQAYWDTYISLFPAASFGAVREHFYQMTFYYFCHRFMLPGSYPKLEEELPAGRADLTYQGVAGTAQAGRAFVVEFKHRTVEQRLPEAPLTEDIRQVKAYAAGKERLIGLPVTTFLLYTQANRGFSLFQV